MRATITQTAFIDTIKQKYTEVLLIGHDRRTGAIDIIHQLKPHSVVTSTFQRMMHKIYGRLTKLN